MPLSYLAYFKAFPFSLLFLGTRIHLNRFFWGERYMSWIFYIIEWKFISIFSFDRNLGREGALLLQFPAPLLHLIDVRGPWPGWLSEEQQIIKYYIISASGIAFIIYFNGRNWREKVILKNYFLLLERINNFVKVSYS